MAALATVLLAQATARPPGSARPEALALPAFRLHVLASEDLPADALKMLANPSVVLWLSTRSNALRESVVEALARFDEAYVELRPPLLEAHVQILSKAPYAGAWLDASALGGALTGRLGHRRKAVRIRGALSEEIADRVRGAHPVRIEWEPSGEVDLYAWSVFRQLPGRKLVKLSGLTPSRVGPASPCGLGRKSAAPALWLDARATFVGLWPLACGRGARARVEADVADDVLRWLYRNDPAVELEIHVGDDVRAASRAKALLRRLTVPLWEG